MRSKEGSELTFHEGSSIHRQSFSSLPAEHSYGSDTCLFRQTAEVKVMRKLVTHLNHRRREKRTVLYSTNFFLRFGSRDLDLARFSFSFIPWTLWPLLTFPPPKDVARPDRPLDDERSFGAPMLPPFLLLLFRWPVDDVVVVLLDGTVASVVLAAAAPSYFGLLGIVTLGLSTGWVKRGQLQPAEGRLT